VSSRYVRGMLIGINQDCFEIENIEDGDYHVKFVIKKIKQMVFDGLYCLYMVQHKKSTENTFYQN
jgi:hypothetical protein